MVSVKIHGKHIQICLEKRQTSRRGFDAVKTLPRQSAKQVFMQNFAWNMMCAFILSVDHKKSLNIHVIRDQICCISQRRHESTRMYFFQFLKISQFTKICNSFFVVFLTHFGKIDRHFSEEIVVSCTLAGNVAFWPTISTINH